MAQTSMRDLAISGAPDLGSAIPRGREQVQAVRGEAGRPDAGGVAFQGAHALAIGGGPPPAS
eukprot:3918471-Alexandrium_andersonii.AAC.1